MRVRPTTIYFVRHGQTALNAQGRFCGRQNPPLDEVGKKQAQDLADQFKKMQISVVYSSPLLRAWGTSDPVVTALGRRGRRTAHELIDLDFGGWEGLSTKQASVRDPDLMDAFRRAPLQWEAPGGKRMLDALTRVSEGVADLLRGNRGRNLIAVTHEIPVRLVLAGFSMPEMRISGDSTFEQEQSWRALSTTMVRRFRR